ncbi:MAG: T9SS type A sorting domain-containing protein [Calditrichaeota bacterium]|nr:T9SS type A sorting domain-containing protein [Calditrichota bacterium]
MTANTHPLALAALVFTSLAGNDLNAATTSNNIALDRVGSRIQLQSAIGSSPMIRDEGGSAHWILEGAVRTGTPGYPDLPAVTRFIRLPDKGAIAFDYDLTGTEIVSGSPPSITPIIDGESDPILSSASLRGVWPPEPVVLFDPVVARGVRFAQLIWYPVQWDAGRAEYRVSRGFSADIQVSPGTGVNEVPDIPRQRSKDFERAISALLDEDIRRDEPDEDVLPGGYLVVANENPPGAVGEFVEWKRRAGHPVELLTFNPLQVNRQQLKALIQERYNETGFEFLLFMGTDDAQGAPLRIPIVENNDFNQHEIYDSFFGQLEGNDIVPDVAVGSFNCTNADNLTCAIRRSLSYQFTPYIDDWDWFSRGAVAVGHCSVPQDLSPSYTGKWVAETMTMNGFVDLTTTYYSDNEDNDFSDLIAEVYNERSNLIIVRGHQQDVQPGAYRNRFVYPFHFLVSSSTISPPNGGAWNQLFRIGTPQDMRGPSAGFGHYPSPRTNCANALVGGLAEALFLKEITSFGWARWWTVVNLPRLFPAEVGQQSINRYWGTFRYYGDPGQKAWIGEPVALEFNRANLREINGNDNQLPLTVRDGNRGVPRATVTFYQPNGLQVVRTADADGRVLFTWQQGDLNADEDLYVTAVNENSLPTSLTIQVIDEPTVLALLDAEPLETDGNGDGIISPGESFELTMMVESETEFVFSGIDYIDPWLEGGLDVRDAVIEQLGERIYRVVIRQQDGNGFRVIEGCPDGTRIRIDFIFLHPMGLPRLLPVEIPVFAARFSAGNVVVEGDRDPGEEVEVRFDLINIGRIDAEEVQVEVRPLKPNALVRDGVREVGDIPSNGEAVEVAIPVLIDPRAFRGEAIPLSLIVTGQPGVRDKIEIAFTLAGPVETDPLGPDKYGYFALEDSDDDTEWGDAPVFDWTNISPWGGEVEGSEVLPLPGTGETDSSVVIDLPIDFRYYGREFRQITVCNNGWIAVGDQQRLKNQQNWPMAGINGAYGMISPFWDRLEMVTRSDGVFIWHDEEQGHFVIQWQTGTRNNNNQWLPNAFQVILHDSDQWATPTGDSPILFQYQTVNNVQDQWEANTGCTVGISSPDGQEGLTYTYWQRQPSSVSGLRNERAILWTTTGWIPFVAIYGQVTRFIDSAAVEGARVRFSNGVETLTNRDGVYRLGIPALAEGELNVTKSGYGRGILQDIEPIEEGDSLEANFVLPHGWVTGVMPHDTTEVELGRDEPVELVWNLGNQGNIDAWVGVEVLWVDSAFGRERFVIPADSVGIEIGSDVEVVVTIDARDAPEGRYRAILRFNSNTPQGHFDVYLRLAVSSGVGSEPGLPSRFELTGIYPNPFNDQAQVSFALPKSGSVFLTIHNLLGREVLALPARYFPAGRQSLTFDARELPSGVYLLRLSSGPDKGVMKAVMLR